MANPTVLRWLGPTTYTDGSPFGQADYAGFEVEVNGSGAVALPVQFAANNQYSLQLSNLASVQAEAGARRTFTVRLRTVASNGLPSDWSAPLSFDLDLRVPNPPTSLVAA